ncbi:MAG: hypothetical protein RLZZ500_2520 [Bacteroidota bacterium]|jgi:gliding motility-associated-like protein
MPKFRILFLLFFPLLLWGQSDCVNAVVTCGNVNFTNIPVNGPGNIQELSGQTSCGTEEYDSVWIKVSIKTGGTLAFTITPASTGLIVDYDFFIFDGSSGCDNIGSSIRCSTTNPLLAGLNTNITGLNTTETDEFEGPGPDGNGFVNAIPVSPNEVYFIVVNRAIGSGNFSLNWTGTATFNDPPVVNTNNIPTYLDLNLCQIDSNQGVDITQNSALAIGTQTNIIASYFLTEGDAITNLNPIVNPTDFHFTTNPQTLYVRLENTISGCSAYTSFKLTTTNLNLPTLTDLTACDPNGTGFETFNLTPYANLLNPNGTNTVTFLNAQNSTTPLPLLYTNSVAYQDETIWAHIVNTTTNCSGYKSFTLKVNPLPTIINTQLSQCDFEFNPDGLTTYDLSLASPIVTNGNPDYVVTYYLNDTDANSNIGNLNSIFTNTQNPQVITAKVTHTLTGCAVLAHVTLSTSVTPTQTVTLTNCVDPTSGSSAFTFSNAGFEGGGNIVTYHSTVQDALLEQNPILTQPYLSSTPNQYIYVRIENATQDCIGIHRIQLEHYEIPQASLSVAGILCLNTPLQPVFINCQVTPSGTYSFAWSPGTSLNSQLAVYQPGQYTVTVTNTITGCQNTASVQVDASEIPTFNQVMIEDLVDNNTVTVVVDGVGTYWYSLDDQPLQSSSVFEGVLPGDHEIKVWDENGCGMVFQTISVLGIPKYFTPNGDGIHDFWQIKGLHPNASKVNKLHIFDRYGKLLYKIDPLKSGWDGTINKSQAPADDYWYVLEMIDGRIFKGHFTLKR